VRATYEDIVMHPELQDTMIDFIKSLKMAKIPAITGGPTGVAGSSAGLKRKRAEQQSDDEEEREEMDDNGTKRGKQGDQKSKAMKSSTSTTSNAKPSGSIPTSKVSLPWRVKRAVPGPSSFVPTQVPKQPDRMAAFGDTISQKQQQPSALPDVPRALPKAPSSLTGLDPPNPQMSPSPSQSFSVLSSPSNLSLPNDTSNQNSYKHTPNNTNDADSNIVLDNPNVNVNNHNTGMNTTLPLPVSPPLNVMETSLVATMVRKCMETIDGVLQVSGMTSKENHS
jgi:hypothetical protein